jgi:hypothetical protein
VTKITLTEDDRQTRQQWLRSDKSEQRLVLRDRIMLAAAEGRATQAIAQQLRQRTATVSKEPAAHYFEVHPMRAGRTWWCGLTQPVQACLRR